MCKRKDSRTDKKRTHSCCLEWSQGRGYCRQGPSKIMKNNANGPGDSLERTQIVDVPVPQILGKLVSQERVQERSLQRTVERASRDFVGVDKNLSLRSEFFERSEVIEVPKISYQGSRLVRLGVYFRMRTCSNDGILLACLLCRIFEAEGVSTC